MGGGDIRFVTEEYYNSDLRNTTLRKMWDNLYAEASIALHANSISTIEIVDYREEKKRIELKVETGGKENEINE